MDAAASIGSPLYAAGVPIFVSAYLPSFVRPDRREHLTWLFRGRFLGEQMPRPQRGLWNVGGAWHCSPDTFAAIKAAL